MKEKTDKILTLAMLAVALLATVFAVLFAIGNGSVVDQWGSNYYEHVVGHGNFTAVFAILICIVAVSLLIMACFWVIRQLEKFSTDSKYWMKFLTVIIVAVVVIGLAFLLSTGNDIPTAFLEKNETSTGVSKLIGTACIMVYILAAGTIVSILFTEIAKLFKK